jgi:hypothetical protein
MSAAEGIWLTPDGGVVKRILRSGDGAVPTRGSTVAVAYTGALGVFRGCTVGTRGSGVALSDAVAAAAAAAATEDGTVFDTSERYGPSGYVFTLGVGDVYKGARRIVDDVAGGWLFCCYVLSRRRGC